MVCLYIQCSSHTYAAKFRIRKAYSNTDSGPDVLYSEVVESREQLTDWTKQHGTLTNSVSGLHSNDFC